MDTGAWWASVHGVAKSQTRLHFHFSLSCIGEGNGNPLQCSCLENPRDGGAWWAAVYGVAQSQTWLKWLSSSSSNRVSSLVVLESVLALQRLRTWSLQRSTGPGTSQKLPCFRKPFFSQDANSWEQIWLQSSAHKCGVSQRFLKTKQTQSSVNCFGLANSIKLSFNYPTKIDKGNLIRLKSHDEF